MFFLLFDEHSPIKWCIIIHRLFLFKLCEEWFTQFVFIFFNFFVEKEQKKEKDLNWIDDFIEMLLPFLYLHLALSWFECTQLIINCFFHQHQDFLFLLFFFYFVLFLILFLVLFLVLFCSSDFFGPLFSFLHLLSLSLSLSRWKREAKKSVAECWFWFNDLNQIKKIGREKVEWAWKR